MSLHSRLKDEQIIDGIRYLIHPTKRFAISKCGKVLGRTGRILKPKSQGNYQIVGYQIHTDEGPKIRQMYVHRMVAEVWVDNPDNLNEVNHIDGVKINNNHTNLEWVDRSGNIKHAMRLGLFWNVPTKGQRGFQTR